jgi:hypothetical protein
MASDARADEFGDVRLRIARFCVCTVENGSNRWAQREELNYARAALTGLKRLASRLIFMTVFSSIPSVSHSGSLDLSKAATF